jgi:hypothetical protein
VAKGGPDFVWVDRTLFENVGQLDQKIIRGMIAVIEYSRPQVENYMKSNAPWQDQTTNARNSLSATTQHGGVSSSIICAHGVPYGIWLEVRFGGVNGIIPQTLRVMGARVMANMRTLFARMG